LLKIRAHHVTAGILLFALASMIGPMGHGASLSATTAQHDSLLFTVNPDRNVGIGWNTSTSFPINQSISSLFLPGQGIQSSTTFTQQSNAVVETTNVQYQLPAQIYSQVPYSLIQSISLSATEAANSTSGSLSITDGLAVQNVNLVFATSPTRISANATTQIYFSQSTYSGTIFANETIFQSTWAKTFQNVTWINTIKSQIQNATSHALTVQTFSGTVTYPNFSSANVSIQFLAIPSGTSTDFVTALENALTTSMTPIPAGIDSIIRSALKLVTGESLNFTYTGSTGKLVVQYTTDYVSNLDAQLNSIKNQFFQLVLNLQPVGTVTPQEKFLNSTSITVSKISMTSNLDLHAGAYSTTLNGLTIAPPTEGASSNFTIHGLFQTLGTMSFTSVGANITLVGGSDSSNQVKVVVPAGAGVPAPSSTTSNSATWMNVQNASELQNVRFVVQALPFSFLAFLTSTPGFILEAIIAAAVIAGIILYARKRGSRTLAPVAPSGPTTPPGFGPSPAPPTPSQVF